MDTFTAQFDNGPLHGEVRDITIEGLRLNFPLVIPQPDAEVSGYYQTTVTGVPMPGYGVNFTWQYGDVNDKSEPHQRYDLHEGKWLHFEGKPVEHCCEDNADVEVEAFRSGSPEEAEVQRHPADCQPEAFAKATKPSQSAINTALMMRIYKQAVRNTRAGTMSLIYLSEEDSYVIAWRYNWNGIAYTHDAEFTDKRLSEFPLESATRLAQQLADVINETIPAAEVIPVANCLLALGKKHG